MAAQIITIIILYLFCFIIWRRNNYNEEIEEPYLPDNEREGSFVWRYERGNKSTYKMIKLTHTELREGIVAVIDNGWVELFHSRTKQKVEDFLFKAPQFNYEFLRKSMKRYLQAKVPNDTVKFGKPKTLKQFQKESQRKEIQTLTKSSELNDIVGGKQNRLQKLFGLVKN